MKLLNYLFVILGLYILLKSIFDVRMYGELFCDRNTFANERYRKQERSADIASIIHSMYLLSYGFVLFVVGGGGAATVPGRGLLTLFLVMVLMSVLDFSMILYTEKRHGLKQVEEQIRAKWKREKVFDREVHDDEVNMVRAVERLERFKTQSCLSLAFAVIVLLICCGTLI